MCTSFALNRCWVKTFYKHKGSLLYYKDNNDTHLMGLWRWRLIELLYVKWLQPYLARKKKKHFDWKKQSVFVGNTQQFWLLHRKRQCLLLLLYDVSTANMASFIAQLVKNPPAMQETPVWFLGQEDPLEKGYPLQYSWASLVAQLVRNPPAVCKPWVGKIPWKRDRLPTSVFWPGEFDGLYSPWGCKELTGLSDFLSLHFHC